MTPTRVVITTMIAVLLPVAVASMLRSLAEQRNHNAATAAWTKELRSAVVRSLGGRLLPDKPTAALIRGGRVVRGCYTIGECVAWSESGDEIRLLDTIRP